MTEVLYTRESKRNFNVLRTNDTIRKMVETGLMFFFFLLLAKNCCFTTFELLFIVECKLEPQSFYLSLSLPQLYFSNTEQISLFEGD